MGNFLAPLCKNCWILKHSWDVQTELKYLSVVGIKTVLARRGPVVRVVDRWVFQADGGRPPLPLHRCGPPAHRAQHQKWMPRTHLVSKMLGFYSPTWIISPLMLLHLPLGKSDIWKAASYQKLVKQLSFAEDYMEKMSLFLRTSTYLSNQRSLAIGVFWGLLH